MTAKIKFNPAGDAGYSFLELIVAITVLAIVVVPMVSLVVGGYTTMVLAGRQTVASNLCRDKIEEIKAMGYTDAHSHYIESANSPATEDPVPGFSFFHRVTEVDEIVSEVLSDAYLLRIKVTVSWVIEGVTRSVEMETSLSKRE